MKLLYDNNLSYKLVNILNDVFPDSTHTKFVKLASESDAQIWEYASRNNFIIVSKDEDFHEISMLRGHPPKLIWIRTGNCSLKHMENIIRKNIDNIQIFSQNQELAELMIW